MYPVIDDMGLGVDAWAIDDHSTYREDGYRVSFTTQEISDAASMGWRLSARLRIVHIADELDFTAAQIVIGTGGSGNFAMGFNHEDHGSPLVNVGSEREPIVVDLDDLDDGYHLYEMVFNPSMNEAELFVDGALRASNIQASTYYDRSFSFSVTFGSTFTAGTGHANYNLVKYEIMSDSNDTGPQAPELEIQLHPAITLTGEAGSTYVIESKTAVEDDFWVTRGVVELTSTQSQWFDSVPADGPRRIYRALKVTKPEGVQPIENMVWIPAGTFTMGSPDTERGRWDHEGPLTRVTLTQSFWMSKYEVTQREYLAMMGNNPSFFPGFDGFGGPGPSGRAGNVG